MGLLVDCMGKGVSTSPIENLKIQKCKVFFKHIAMDTSHLPDFCRNASRNHTYIKSIPHRIIILNNSYVVRSLRRSTNEALCENCKRVGEYGSTREKATN